MIKLILFYFKVEKFPGALVKSLESSYTNAPFTQMFPSNYYPNIKLQFSSSLTFVNTSLNVSPFVINNHQRLFWGKEKIY